MACNGNSNGGGAPEEMWRIWRASIYYQARAWRRRQAKAAEQNGAGGGGSDIMKPICASNNDISINIVINVKRQYLPGN